MIFFAILLVNKPVPEPSSKILSKFVDILDNLITNLYNYETDDVENVIGADGVAKKSDYNRSSDFIAVTLLENYSGRFWNHERETLGYSICYYDINKKGTKTILFIPGGSYIDNPTEIHWLFVEKLTSMCDARIIMPIYPKLPLHNYKECYSKLEKLMTLMPEDLIFIL